MDKLRDQLILDLHSAEGERTELDEKRKLLDWKIEYLRTLLSSASAPEPVSQSRPSTSQQSPDSLPAVAQKVLEMVGKPMRVQEIISHAISSGLLPRNIDRDSTRMNLSSAFSKSILRKRGKWIKLDRGLYDIAERNGHGSELQKVEG